MIPGKMIGSWSVRRCGLDHCGDRTVAETVLPVEYLLDSNAFFGGFVQTCTKYINFL